MYIFSNFFNDESLVIKAEKLEKEEDILALKLNLKEINSDPNFFFENEFYYLITSRRIDIYESSESQYMKQYKNIPEE